MSKRIFAIGIAALAFGSLASSTAFAGEGSGETSVETPMCKSYDDFATFKDTCVNPKAYNHQIPPKQINITCEKLLTKWVPNRTSIELRLPIKIDSSVDAWNNKLHCTDDRSLVSEVQTEYATCIEFEHKELKYSRTIQATCDDVLRFESAMALCDATLQNAGAWAQVQEARSTGCVVNSCGGQTPACQELQLKLTQ